MDTVPPPSRPLANVHELPLFGSLFALQRDPLAFVKRVASECGDAGRFQLGPVASGVVFNSAGTVDQVLVHQSDAFAKSSMTLRAYHAIDSRPVLIAEGVEHVRQREALDPAFTAELARYADVMTRVADLTQSRWADRAKLDVQQQLQVLTLPLMGEALFGIEDLDATDGFVQRMDLIPEYLSHAVRSPLPLRVRKGELVLISPFTMHRRADYCPVPDRFDPHRFTPGAEPTLPPLSFIPFGAGPHDCLGAHFALLEAHIVLATLVQRVEFELLPGQRVEPAAGLLLRQRDGWWAMVHRRA